MVKKNKIIPVLFLDIVVPSKKPEVQKRKKKAKQTQEAKADNYNNGDCQSLAGVHS